MSGFFGRMLNKYSVANRIHKHMRQTMANKMTMMPVRTSIHDTALWKRNRRWYWGIAGFTSIFWAPILGVNVRRTINAKAQEAKVDYNAVRKDIKAVLDDKNWDDGSWGPVLLRLAWHASGTYDRATGTGGSDGATMRFAPEANFGANAGLANARARLEKIKSKYPGLSYADLWTLAGVVAIEEMGGPTISWRPGRSDKPDGKSCPPDGRLPDASKGPPHVREIFSRMGFSDQEMVALIGAHAVGRCHTDRSGYTGPWTNSPTYFSNDFYVQLLERKWTPKKWSGPKQFEDESGELMMTPADLAFIEDPAFKKWVEVYAKDEGKWHQDFANAFSKMLELGVKFK